MYIWTFSFSGEQQSGSFCDSSEVDSGSESSLKEGRRYAYHPSVWADTPEEPVEPYEVPYDVDGTHKYKIKCHKSEMMKVSKDGRPWDVWINSSRKNFHGVRRLAKCKGSYLCRSNTCCLDNKPNQVQFTKTNSSVVCSICGLQAEWISCPARKVWEHNKDELTVMYRGKHTCVAKQRKISRKMLAKAIEAHPGIPPSKLVVNEMSGLLSENTVDWEKVEGLANQYADMKRVHNVKAEIMDEENAHGHSFDTVCHLKQEADKKDKYLIYKINNHNMNNGKPSYVFKSSQAMAEIALEMDHNGSSPLSKCHAHVDAKHGRVRGMKTITLWVQHPVVRRVLCLATMDVMRENEENLTLFWETFNEMLQEVSGVKKYKFNPVGWIVDENAANWKSIQAVFGDEAAKSTFSCKFHFKESLVKHSHKVVEGQDFKDLGNAMLEACTESAYEMKYMQMKQFSADNNGIFDEWLAWWHKRRTHIFRAFKPIDVPNTNLAEIGHAQMANTTESNMLLIKACRVDIAQALRQNAIVQAFFKGGVSCGRVTNKKQRQRMSYKKQMQHAKVYAQELSSNESVDEGNSIYVPRHGLHRPPNKKT